MIVTFTSWVKDIIFVVLFASFLELLLPSSSMQRFVRVIMGLFIMLTILNPIIDVIQNHVTPAQIPAMDTSAANSATILTDAKAVARDREQLSTDIYIKELAKQMRVMIIALEGVSEAKVVIDANHVNDNKASNRIGKVAVYVTPGAMNTGVNIAKLSIGQQVDPKAELHIELQNKIKKMIIELYQLPKEIVEIKILHS